MVDSTPLIPSGEAEASKPQRHWSWWPRAAWISAVQFTNIIILLPYFGGKSCPAIPSALAYAITFATVGFLRGPCTMINNYHRIKSGMRPSFDTTPKEGLEYGGQRAVHAFDSAMGILTLFIGLLWGLPISLTNTQYMSGDDPECDSGVYFLVFISAVITSSIFVLIVVGGTIWYFFFRKKTVEEDEEK